MLDFELTAFNPDSKQGKLRVLYKTNNELWRFVTEVPGTLNNESGNFYRLFWEPKNANFTIDVNGVNIVEN